MSRATKYAVRANLAGFLAMVAFAPASAAHDASSTNLHDVCGVADVVFMWGELLLPPVSSSGMQPLDLLLDCERAPESNEESEVNPLPDPFPCARLLKAIADIVAAETWLRPPMRSRFVRSIDDAEPAESAPTTSASPPPPTAARIEPPPSATSRNDMDSVSSRDAFWDGAVFDSDRGVLDFDTAGDRALRVRTAAQANPLPGLPPPQEGATRPLEAVPVPPSDAAPAAP